MSGSSSSHREALSDAVAGVIASLVAMLAFYPLDSIKTNLQASFNNNNNNNNNNFKEAALMLFRGIRLKAAHTTVSSFAYFYFYSLVQKWHRNSKNKNKKYNPSPTPRERLVLAAVAAVMNTLLTLPLDVAASRSQTKTSFVQRWRQDDDTNANNKTTTEKKKEAFSALSQNTNNGKIHFRELKSYWRGLGPSILLASNPAIQYTVFDLIKERVIVHLLLKQQSTSRRNNDDSTTSIRHHHHHHQQQQQLTMFSAFVVGLVSKSIATIITYPLIRTKILMMCAAGERCSTTTTTKSCNNESGRCGSMKQTFAQILQQEGLLGFYKGCDLQLIHTVLKSALLMMVRERIIWSTRRFFRIEEN